MGFSRGALESSETPETAFETYAALAESGYLKKGWIPEYLPWDITNIAEVHNMDSNAVWIESDFTGQLPIDPKTMVHYGSQDVKNRIVKRWGLQYKSVEFYTRLDSGGVIAIDSQRGKLYFHRPGQ